MQSGPGSGSITSHEPFKVSQTDRLMSTADLNLVVLQTADVAFLSFPVNLPPIKDPKCRVFATVQTKTNPVAWHS